jgi:hypothetical protein
MKMAGLKLNLQDHYVHDILISSPGDIEGHVGTDGQFYVVDFGKWEGGGRREEGLCEEGGEGGKRREVRAREFPKISF